MADDKVDRMAEKDNPPQPTDGEAGNQGPSAPDMRILIVLIVLVGMVVVAVLMNRKSPKPESITKDSADTTAADSQPLPDFSASSDSTAAPGVMDRKGREESYKAALDIELQQSRSATFRMAGKMLIVAAQPSDPNSNAGELFDVTNRLPGVEADRFQRRICLRWNEPEDGGQPNLMPQTVLKDTFEAIGLTDDLKGSFVKVSESEKSDTDSILALHYGDEWRAYPIRYMVYHEIVNDVIAGEPVSIFLNTLSGGSVALLTKKDKGQYRFGSAGVLYNGDFIVYDKDTESLWSPQLGECLAGELVGTKLPQLEVFTTLVGWFKEKHPDGMLLEGTEPMKNYERIRPLPDGYLGTPAMFPIVGYDITDARIYGKDWIYGVVVDGVAKAYPVPYFSSLAGEKLEDTLAGKRIILTYDKDKRFVAAQYADGGDLMCRGMFYMFWQALYPKTELYDAPLPTAPAANEAETPPPGAPKSEGETVKTAPLPTATPEVPASPGQIGPGH